MLVPYLYVLHVPHSWRGLPAVTGAFVVIAANAKCVRVNSFVFVVTLSKSNLIC